jgi:hypothetical protein
MTRVLSVLDTLDRHNFERAESNNCLDSLYNKIFHPSHTKDNADVSHFVITVLGMELEPLPL